MITKENFIKSITEALVDFKKYLEQSESDWANEEDYTNLSELSRYIIELKKQNRDLEVQKVFDLLGLTFSEGDAYVKEAISIGLLETLQNNISWEGNYADVMPFLPRELKYEWDKIKQSWNKSK